MEITFHKMHGLGNDFVVLDHLESHYSLSAEQISKLSNRRTGIGFDQLLIIEPSRLEGVDAKYRVFNQDGSSAEHCGNGVRCVARYLQARLPQQPSKIVIEIDGKQFELSIDKAGDVTVDMGAPVFEPHLVPADFPQRLRSYPIEVANEVFDIGVVSMGNPHALFVVDDLAHFPVEKIGQAMQNHASFPRQVNAGFMQIENRKSIRLRVFERGVGETLACGTGACAAVAIGIHWGRLDEEVSVKLPGGELLIKWGGGTGDPVWMMGAACYVFEGKINI